MNEAHKEIDIASVISIRAQIRHWESGKLEIVPTEHVKELLREYDSQALEIEWVKQEAQKMRDSLHSNHDSKGEYWPKPEYSWEKI
jgi:hypothetical protein